MNSYVRNLKFVFFGSFHISTEILAQLVAGLPASGGAKGDQGGFMPTHVICSPDRPAGRKKIITPPAIKKLILERAWPIEIMQPEKLEIENLKLEIGEVDLAVVMGYPHIIPDSIINLPRLGTIGVHPSLLPLYRGASPIQSVLLAGETETGVTLYQMDAKMDNGPILAQRKSQIALEDTNETLGHKLSKIAGELLVETIPKFLKGEIKPQEQDHAKATFTRKFTTADGQVDMINDKPEIIYNKIRAFNPEPGCWTMNFPGREGKRVKLLGATMQDGELKITEIQPDGKKPMKV